MSQDVSITHWLERLRQGDTAAAGVLFRAYFERLAHLARAHLSRSVRRAADEEDVALAALHSFFRGVQAGVVWRDDGAHLEPVLPGGLQRGTVSDLGDIPSLAEAVRQLRSVSGVERVAVRAFAVAPKGGE